DGIRDATVTGVQTCALPILDGAWADAGSGATFTAESPATGEAIAEVPEGDREDAQRAIAAANRAAEGWARAGAFGRAAAMHRIRSEERRVGKEGRGGGARGE